MTLISSSRKVLFSFALMASFPASADWFHKVVRYRCEPQMNRLLVTYEGAYNEAGEQLIQDKGPNAWDPWKLLRTDKKKERIIGTKTINRRCALIDGTYGVSISGIHQNANPAGHCGAHVTAELVIRKAQSKVYATAFEGGCDDIFSSKVITKVVVIANAQSPQVTDVLGNDFYK